MLARMFSEENGYEPKRLPDGAYFIDRDGSAFRYVLNFLRDGRVGLPDSPFERTQLYQEAQFFMLDGLANLCSLHWRDINFAIDGSFAISRQIEALSDSPSVCGDLPALVLHGRDVECGTYRLRPVAVRIADALRHATVENQFVFYDRDLQIFIDSILRFFETLTPCDRVQSLRGSLLVHKEKRSEEDGAAVFPYTPFVVSADFRKMPKS